MMAPTSVSSRFSARPVMPLPKSSISLSIASVRPSIFATPSPISRTSPTFCLATDVLSPEIWASISCNRLLINSSFVVRGQLLLSRPGNETTGGSKFFRQFGQAGADAAVVDVASHLHAQAADQFRILREGYRQSRTVAARQIRLDAHAQIVRDLNRAFDFR